jgi:uncharacterized protein (TIGR02147 family)
VRQQFGALLWSKMMTSEFYDCNLMDMQTNEPFYLYTLRESLLSRQRRNSSYSLRAFAKDLEIDSSNLSAILQNKRALPHKRAIPIARKLKLSPKAHALFIASTLRKQMALDSIRVSNEMKNYLLDDKYHKIISEWEHYTFLQLLKLRNFQANFEWIANRLGISQCRARTVVGHLLDLGFIQEDVQKGYVRATPSLETSEDIESQALRASHRDSLEIGKSKLESVPIERRDFSSVTMAIDTKKIPQAKAIIREFQDKLYALLVSETQDEVYQFNCQLFPLTQGEK